MRLLLLFALAISLVAPLARAKDTTGGGDSPLGSTTESEAALIGMLYDLKQKMGETSGVNNTPEYDKIIAQFITKGWDESVLNKFYRISHPFYTTQIFIPMMGNQQAPKAFGVQNHIKDGYWVMHYKGQVIPPSDGRFRFAGYAHATMLVAINGKLVLNGCRFSMKSTDRNFPLLSAQKPSDANAGAPAGDFVLSVGPWITLKHSEPVDIDILFGNRLAAELCAFLLVEKEGETYPIDPATNFPILPLFQVAHYDGEPLPQGKLATKCLTNAMIWKCLQ